MKYEKIIKAWPTSVLGLQAVVTMSFLSVYFTELIIHGVPHASAYQNKRIQNWDDIYTLFASDRTTGDGAEQYEESAATMELENEAISTFDIGLT